MAGTTKKLAVSALLLALDVVLTRLLAINTPIMKIGLGFVPVALSAMLYGPWWGALMAALGDVVGSLLLPTGAYFPGFTLTAAGTGLLFGLCLYERGEKTTASARPRDEGAVRNRNGGRLVRALLAAVLNCVLVSYLANSAMISLISDAEYGALLKVRAVQLAVMLPVQALALSWLRCSDTLEKLSVRFAYRE